MRLALRTGVGLALATLVVEIVGIDHGFWVVLGVIATLLVHEGRLARLRAAARDRYRFVPCEDWTSLTRACERGAVSLVVFDLYVDGRADFERVRQLRLRVPRAALVAFLEGTPGATAYLQLMGVRPAAAAGACRGSWPWIGGCVLAAV
jgi:hypothetical protein